jgi:tRNA modification GTPase
MAETIFALASGAGRAAVALIRMSGPACGPALARLTGRCPPPRHLTYSVIRHPVTGVVLDRGLVAWFPAPASFTGEASAEFQVHGSRAVVAALIDALGALPGCRLAKPGEFTQRAFANGKLDLAAVEGLADLIDAQTEAQRRQALHQLDGALGRWVDQLRRDLLQAAALAEAAIDFVDESDVVSDAMAQARADVRKIAERIRAELSRHTTAERVRDGFTIALSGPPNAGKSTLLNSLARRDVALVSPIAGTTRDAIEVELDLGGFAVVLVDTAGLRESSDALEQAGMDRARARVARADLVLWLQDASTDPVLPEGLESQALLSIGTKLDLVRSPRPGFDLTVSAQAGTGLPELLARLQAIVSEALVGGESALVTRARHHGALAAALACLTPTGAAWVDAEIMAEDLRAANRALATLIEPIDPDEILGSIFARFCIGK